jgi:hypothetical protein
MSKKKFDPTDTKDMTDELDQSAFFRPHPAPQPAVDPSPISANAETQKSANLQKQNSANAETQRAALRKTYDKTSYRLCPEAFDAINAAKQLLKRKFGLRVSFEDIAEIALIVAQEDLEQNGDQSELVKRLSAILQKQK